jgi:hypothetical protein
MDDSWFPIDDYDSNIRDAECEGDDEQEYPSDDGEYDEPIAPTPQITEESIKRKHDDEEDDDDNAGNPFSKKPTHPTPQITEQFIKRKHDEDDDDDNDGNPFSKKKLKNQDDPVTISKIEHATKEIVDYKLYDGIPPVYETFGSLPVYDTIE